MAELEQTTDPTALVPGSLGDVDAIAALCAKRADPADQAAETVRRAGEVDDWSGNAAEAYAARVIVVAGRWEATRSALVSVSAAMKEYSSQLLAAQSRAADAIEAWEYAASLVATEASGPFTAVGARPSWLFDVFDADSIRPPQTSQEGFQRARAMLADARVALAAAGDDAAAVVTAALAQVQADDAVWASLGSSLGTPTVTSAQVLTVLARLSAPDLTSLLGARPDLIDLLATSAPTDVAGWWGSLSADQQDALMHAAPAVIGNLGGVAYIARSEANRIWLHDQIAEARADVKVWQGSRYQVAAAQTRLDALENIESSLTSPAGKAPRFLISLTADNPPLAAVSIGDMDKAENVTYAVPGLGTTTDGMSDWARSAQNIASAQDRVDPAHSHAVVAWIGYVTPAASQLDDGFSVMGTGLAQVGAAKLDTALAGFNAVRADAQVNVVAHSYGTTTAAIALIDPGTHVDTFVSLASAGLPPEIDQASDINADQVYAGQAQNVLAIDSAGGDQWAWTGRLSTDHPVDPISADFGAQAFSVAGGAGLQPVTDHGVHTAEGTGYLDPMTESVGNVALATTGQGSYASAYVPPEPTPFEQGLMNGITNGR